MATVTERLERIERLLTEPGYGWRFIPLLAQTRVAADEVRQLRWAITAAQERRQASG